MPMAPQTRKALGRIAIQPGVERVGVARLQQAVTGDGMRARPIGDLQYGGAALAHIRLRVVVADVLELASLRPTQDDHPASVLLGHGELPSRYAPCP
jgi:hypothetical protein